jgi:hypothetical protein
MDTEYQHWDEDKTRFQPRLKLYAETYKPYILFDSVPCEVSEHGTVNKGNVVFGPGGNCWYCNKILKAGEQLDVAININRIGTVEWDADVIVPIFIEAGKLWMSYTPNEVFTLREGIRRASGTVMVGGLGLGWFLKKVHERPEVNRVIVVDKCQELLDWYGYDLCKTLPKVTDIICDDVYDQIGRFGAQTKMLLDIWKKHGEIDDDKQFQSLKRKYKYMWGWGQDWEGKK